MNLAITNNTIDYAGTQRAIYLATGQDGAGALHVTATNNNIDVKLKVNAEDIDTDRHLAARGAIVTVEHPTRGSTRVVGNPVRLHGAPVALTAPPILGEHTREVLGAELGLDEGALEALSRARVIG